MLINGPQIASFKEDVALAGLDDRGPADDLFKCGLGLKRNRPIANMLVGYIECWAKLGTKSVRLSVFEERYLEKKKKKKKKLLLCQGKMATSFSSASAKVVYLRPTDAAFRSIAVFLACLSSLYRYLFWRKSKGKKEEEENVEILRLPKAVAGDSLNDARLPFVLDAVRLSVF